MDLSPTSRGSYFSPEFFKFLKSLSRNNNREWFQKNKPRYERFVLTPSLQFIKDAGKELRVVSPYLVAEPWSSGTGEEERNPTRGYTFTWRLGRVLRAQAFGILTPRRSTGSGGLSCPGPRLGDGSRRAG